MRESAIPEFFVLLIVTLRDLALAAVTTGLGDWADGMRGATKQGGINIKKAVVGKLDSGWVLCPKCGRKLARVVYGAKASGVEVRCSRCRTEIEIRA